MLPTTEAFSQVWLSGLSGMSCIGVFMCTLKIEIQKVKIVSFYKYADREYSNIHKKSLIENDILIRLLSVFIKWISCGCIHAHRLHDDDLHDDAPHAYDSCFRCLQLFPPGIVLLLP